MDVAVTGARGGAVTVAVEVSRDGGATYHTAAVGPNVVRATADSANPTG